MYCNETEITEITKKLLKNFADCEKRDQFKATFLPTVTKHSAR